jgi:hypothetical protein
MEIEVGKYAEMLPLLKKILDEQQKVEDDKINEACRKKGMYDKKTAETIRNSLRKRGHLVREYPCDICNWWHLTHKQKY